MSNRTPGLSATVERGGRATGAFYASVLLFVVALGLAGSLYLAQGLREQSSLEPYVGGQTVIGRVIATRAVLDTSPTTWVSIVKFEVGGRTYQVKTLDTSEYLAIGSLQVLSYLPAAPGLARDVSQRRGQWSEPIEFGIVADLVAVVLGGVVVTRLVKLRGWVHSVS